MIMDGRAVWFLLVKLSCTWERVTEDRRKGNWPMLLWLVFYFYFFFHGHVCVCVRMPACVWTQVYVGEEYMGIRRPT